MANLKELAEETAAKNVTTKKATKPKMSFTAGSPVNKEVVGKDTPNVKETDTTSKPIVETVAKTEAVKSLPVEEDKLVNETTNAVEHTPKTKYNNYDLEGARKHANAIREANATTKPVYTKQNPHKPNSKRVNGKELPSITDNYPQHFVDLALIIKNNAEIRRYTSLGILNILMQKGEIKGKNRFVNFKWDMFTVKVDKLSKDYAYTEPFFLNSLAAAFASFSASAQRTIDNFINVELNLKMDDVMNNDEISKIHEDLSNN